MRKIFKWGLLLLFLAGAAVALIQIVTISSEYSAGEDAYDEMQAYVRIDTEPENKPEPETPETTPPSTTAQAESEPAATEPEPTLEPLEYPEVDFDSLLSVNQDVVGWIYIADTKINYPVLLGEDNRTYVNTMINGSYNAAGSIFMDYHNAADFSDRHTILYGHNMRSGSMFAGITRYRNQEYYDAHPVGQIMTPEGNFRFEIVSGYVASLADSAWQLEFVDDGDALTWLEDAMARSSFTSRYTPKEGDRMITLSTCSYEFSDARFVLVGVLTEE